MKQSELKLDDVRKTPKRRFKSHYTALMSLLGHEHLDNKIIKKESGIISRVLKKGYTDKQLLQACNYLKFKNIKLKSFSLLLWEDCKLVKEALANTVLLPEIKKEEVKLEDKDFRETVEYQKPKKSLKDFLS